MLPDLFYYQDHNVRVSAKGITLEICGGIEKDSVKSILIENKYPLNPYFHEIEGFHMKPY